MNMLRIKRLAGAHKMLISAKTKTKQCLIYNIIPIIIPLKIEEEKFTKFYKNSKISIHLMKIP
jgi:hypothetical protein